MSNTAQLYWHLYVDCPVCEESVDLVDQDDEGRFSQKVFGNDWDSVKGEEVLCPCCGAEFELDGMEY